MNAISAFRSDLSVLRKQSFAIRNITTFLILVSITVAAKALPKNLRCEAVHNPLGIDIATPQLSWQNDSQERNWSQSAYQIFVSTSPSPLTDASARIWDSGKVKSAESVGIAYSGAKLQPRTRYYWSVRVWDTNGKSSEASETAWWETGLLSQEWKAKWIAWKNPDAELDLQGVRWIWIAGQDALHVPAKTAAEFRFDLDLAQRPRQAAMFLLARGGFVAKVNGHEVGTKSGWNDFDREDLSPLLAVGKNSIEVSVTALEPENPDPSSNGLITALAGVLKITDPDGKVTRVPLDEAWSARLAGTSAWQPAKIVGTLSDRQFGAILPGALPQPAALLRKHFEVSKAVKSARLYATALGSYRMFVNNQRVGQDLLTPDFTDYTKRVLYQTYDVTPLVAKGSNAIGAILGDGWFGSAMTWAGQTFSFLPGPTRLLAQLEIEYEDGTRDVVATDDSWRTSASPILQSEIYAGEFHDARLDQTDWAKSSFDDSSWAPALVIASPSIAVVGQVSAPVHLTEQITPVSITPFANGTYVFDMGQNMVGWARLKAHGPAGTQIRLRFAEILQPDGSIYRENLRNADATDFFVLAGKGEETFTPLFTFHGFRYVEVTGYPGTPTTADLTGEVINSLDGGPSGTLVTSSDLVNRMWKIGIWGQRGNFLSIPTDCPQRDERLGWMGDAGVFWRTGTFNFDIQAFSHKFLTDITDAQTKEGAFTNVSPDLLRPDGSEGAPGWGDAGVIVPWTVWMQYGDAQAITNNWKAMERWMDYIAKANPDFLRRKGVGPNYADWLAPDEHTPKDLLATSYWALIARMMVDMARATGNHEAVERYTALIENIRKAYNAAYVKDDGEVLGGTQTAYVVTLYTKLAPPALETTMVNKLVADIESRNWHLSTGFLGTPFLLFTLANHGRADVAYRLLLNDTYPSWGYMLSKGATTWWERWNGDTGDPGMNSYNHYAFGSVMAWVYRSVAGIDTNAEGAGYHEIIVHPVLDPHITHARGEYDSVYGPIVSDWDSKPGASFSLNLSIPANTHAKVCLPPIPNARATQDNQPVHVQQEKGCLSLRVGSGTYHLEVK
jgi:alpha-L-rhamnosidase